jgi:hypothetical protein
MEAFVSCGSPRVAVQSRERNFLPRGGSAVGRCHHLYIHDDGDWRRSVISLRSTDTTNGLTRRCS